MTLLKPENGRYFATCTEEVDEEVRVVTCGPALRPEWFAPYGFAETKEWTHTPRARDILERSSTRQRSDGLAQFYSRLRHEVNETGVMDALVELEPTTRVGVSWRFRAKVQYLIQIVERKDS